MKVYSYMYYNYRVNNYKLLHNTVELFVNEFIITKFP